MDGQQVDCSYIKKNRLKRTMKMNKKEMGAQMSKETNLLKAGQLLQSYLDALAVADDDSEALRRAIVLREDVADALDELDKATVKM